MTSTAKDFPTLSTSAMPALTGAEMAAVDRALSAEYGITVPQLMEVAGRAIAVAARDVVLSGGARDQRVLIAVGSGNNGGDGLVAARYLYAWGARVTVMLTRDLTDLTGIVREQARILERLAVPFIPPRRGGGDGAAWPESDLVIDALIGFGLQSAPTGTTARIIELMTASDAPTLAVDVPSGLDATTGEVFSPCVRADLTVTLALPKVGLLASSAADVRGDVLVADIGVPPHVYARLGHQVGPIFAASSFLRWTKDDTS